MLAQEEEASELPLSTVERSRKILQSALEALTILPSDQVLPVFNCMKVLVPKVKDKTNWKIPIVLFGCFCQMYHFFFPLCSSS